MGTTLQANPVRKNRRRVARAMTATAMTATALGLSGLGASPAAADDVVTPLYGMQCTTAVESSHGVGTCTGAGKWRVAVECAFAPNHASVWMVNSPDQTQTAVTGDCFFWVNSVSIQESL